MPTGQRALARGPSLRQAYLEEQLWLTERLTAAMAMASDLEQLPAVAS